MTLNKREKTLAVVTAVLVVLFLGRFLFSAWRGPLQRLSADRDSLQKEVDTKQERIARSKRAQAKLDQFHHRSLPSDPGLARSLYYNWLFELADDVGFRGTDVDVTGDGRQRGAGGAYRALRFNLKAEASLDELTDFLYKFYTEHHLHQIRSLTVTPIERSSNLDVQLTVEALSLPGAETLAVEATEGSFATVTGLTPSLETELVYTGSDGKLTDAAKVKLMGINGIAELGFEGNETLDEARDIINAQKDKTGVVAEVRGDRLSLRREAADSEASAGRLAGSDLDDYREAIAQRNVFAPYRAPPPAAPERPQEPEQPKFDPCQFAYVTGIVRGVDRQPEVWLIARTTGKKYTLRQGDSFEVGDVSAKVIHINRSDAEIEVDGKRWLVPMGNNLREAQPLFEESGERESGQ
jgi:hypothetical protein